MILSGILFALSFVMSFSHLTKIFYIYIFFQLFIQPLVYSERLYQKTLREAQLNLSKTLYITADQTNL